MIFSYSDVTDELISFNFVSHLETMNQVCGNSEGK